MYNVFCTSGPNLVILTWMVDELWCGQAKNGVNFDFDLKFDLEGHGRLPLKTIGTLTKVFFIFGTNLVILAWTGDELSRGQTWWRTDWRTDAGNNNTQRPKLASGNKTGFDWLIEWSQFILCQHAREYFLPTQSPPQLLIPCLHTSWWHHANTA